MCCSVVRILYAYCTLVSVSSARVLRITRRVGCVGVFAPAPAWHPELDDQHYHRRRRRRLFVTKIASLLVVLLCYIPILEASIFGTIS